MRDPKRIKKVLEELEKYWSINPDLRLCQIIENLLPTDRRCQYCSGSGYKDAKPSDKPMVMEITVCLRCQGNGFVTISNYNVEDEVILNKLEILNGIGPVS